MQLLALYRLHAIRNRFWILHIHEKILRNQRGGLGQPRGVGFPIPLSIVRTRLSPVLRCDILCVAAKQHSHPESRALLLAIGSLQRDSRNHYCLPMRNTEFPSVQCEECATRYVLLSELLFQFLKAPSTCHASSVMPTSCPILGDLKLALFFCIEFAASPSASFQWEDCPLLLCLCCVLRMDMGLA